jgi:hypothetical protein
MRAKQIISFLLLGVFVTYITPKEIFHAFTRHNDTEHRIGHNPNQLEVGSEHHHCELMKLDQQFAASDISIPFFSFNKPIYFATKRNSAIVHCILPNANSAIHPLRGPPSI